MHFYNLIIINLYKILNKIMNKSFGESLGFWGAKKQNFSYNSKKIILWENLV